MTYKKNFVACVKIDGKVLRETKDKIELPFGSEYSVLLKNLDSVRMQARISIDGKDATGWLIIPAHQDIEVERFVKDLRSGNRFKFIERTTRIEDHRGIGAEDGLVKVEFKREKIFAPLQPVYHHYDYYYYPRGCYNWPPNITYTSSVQNAQNLAHGGDVTFSNAFGSLGAQLNCSAVNLSKSGELAINEAGITVPGSVSNQQFHEVSGFPTENEEVLVLHLVGTHGSAPVKIVKTVKTKIECDTCGKKNKSSSKFCSECGTSLEKVGG